MIPKRHLGQNGPEVGCLGYGAAVLEGYYGASNDDEGIRTIQAALDAGMTLIDSSDAYGAGHNESLVGRAIQGRRNQALVATKCGVVLEEGAAGSDFPTRWGFNLRVNGTAPNIRKSVDASLARLGVDTIDLWAMHFPDPATPIEETTGTMADVVRSGKVRYLGLSNVTAEQVRRAHTAHPITAVWYEYSLWRRQAEDELLPTLRELGIALVAWSPLGRGFLTGTVATLAKGDHRSADPRYSPENLQTNKQRFTPFMNLAAELGVPPAQLALAWLLHQGADIFPIPGTRHPERIAENARAATLALNAETLRRISELAGPGVTAGIPVI